MSLTMRNISKVIRVIWKEHFYWSVSSLYQRAYKRKREAVYNRTSKSRVKYKALGRITYSLTHANAKYDVDTS